MPLSPVSLQGQKCPEVFEQEFLKSVYNWRDVSCFELHCSMVQNQEMPQYHLCLAAEFGNLWLTDTGKSYLLVKSHPRKFDAKTGMSLITVGLGTKEGLSEGPLSTIFLGELKASVFSSKVLGFLEFVWCGLFLVFLRVYVCVHALRPLITCDFIRHVSKIVSFVSSSCELPSYLPHCFREREAENGYSRFSFLSN